MESWTSLVCFRRLGLSLWQCTCETTKYNYALDFVRPILIWYDLSSSPCSMTIGHPHHIIVTCPLLSPVIMTGWAKLKLMWVKRAWLFDTTAFACKRGEVFEMTESQNLQVYVFTCTQSGLYLSWWRSKTWTLPSMVTAAKTVLRRKIACKKGFWIVFS